jgi:hypothetical protein
LIGNLSFNVGRLHDSCGSSNDSKRLFTLLSNFGSKQKSHCGVLPQRLLIFQIERNLKQRLSRVGIHGRDDPNLQFRFDVLV